MALQAMWVHGHSANIELNNFGRGPGEDIGGRQWTAVEGFRIAEVSSFAVRTTLTTGFTSQSRPL
jgi:hypothetical protein